MENGETLVLGAEKPLISLRSADGVINVLERFGDVYIDFTFNDIKERVFLSEFAMVFRHLQKQIDELKQATEEVE